ncbi:MAG: cytochrome d ubiquinol oxidase subunit II [Candidatus Latescibacterota bacterium]|jgi:cytochrome d ubiquinol oxidase subunit II
MEALWFWLLAWVLATYVVLDGFDFGVGIIHLFVARNEDERAQVLRSIGPVWDGNEVWLLVAGGTLFFAFPKLLAVSFSGFYLALMLVLWLLMFRALGIELRHQVTEPLWRQFWDAAFAWSSALLALFFGAALGNLVRGVSINENGTFFAPLWTDFTVGENVGILDVFTILVAVTAVASLAHHGALWLSARTDESVERRARRAASILWPVVALLAIATTVATFFTQENVRLNVFEMPGGLLLAAIALSGLVGALAFRIRRKAMWAFLSSAAFLYGMVGLAAYGMYPYVLPGRNPDLGLTIQDAAAPVAGLEIALFWWVPGILLACTYFVYVYSSMPATFSVHDVDGH